MTYIVQRKDRFYVVAYDGIDPLTGRERRRWLPVGHDRQEAEDIAGRLASQRIAPPPAKGRPITVGHFLTDIWLPAKRRHVRATTAYRYAWFVERYVKPVVGDVPLRRLRADHLDGLYESLAATGGRTGDALAPKTIQEVHMIIRAALDLAVESELVERNVAHGARARQRPPARAAARAWSATELRTLLTGARHTGSARRFTFAAHTGMRRGENGSNRSRPLGEAMTRAGFTLTDEPGSHEELGCVDPPGLVARLEHRLRSLDDTLATA